MAIEVLPISSTDVAPTPATVPTTVPQLQPAAPTSLASPALTLPANDSGFESSVVVTLGTGRQATFVYNQDGSLQQVVFGISPPSANPAAIIQAAQLATTALALDQESLLAAALLPGATILPDSANFLADENLQADDADLQAFVRSQTIDQTLLALDARQPTPTVLATGDAAAAQTVTPPAGSAALTVAVQLTAADEVSAANAIQAATAPDDPDVLEIDGADLVAGLFADPGIAESGIIDQALALAQPTPPAPLTAALQNPPPTDELAVATGTLLAPTIPAAGTSATVLSPAEPTLQQQILAELALGATETTPTAAATDATLQNLFLVASNQAAFNISANPSYANSLAALILSSTTANIRLIDETGLLMDLPEPVVPVQAVPAARAGV